MKKLTNYQRTAQYLNKVFKLINEEYFNNELEVPTITIQSTVGAYGHVSVNKVWHNDTVATHELNLSADYLNRPIENIVATLIPAQITEGTANCTIPVQTNIIGISPAIPACTR